MKSSVGGPTRWVGWGLRKSPGQGDRRQPGRWSPSPVPTAPARARRARAGPAKEQNGARPGAAPPASPGSRPLGSSLRVPGALEQLSPRWHSARACPSAVSQHVGPLRGGLSPSDAISAGHHTRIWRGLISLALEPRAEESGVGLGPLPPSGGHSQSRHLSSFNRHMRRGTGPFCVSSQSQGGLFCVSLVVGLLFN